MRISANYTANYSSPNKCSKPHFQANIAKCLEETLIREAKQEGVLLQYAQKAKELLRWGSPKSFIVSGPENYVDLKPRTVLQLDNYHVSNTMSGNLGVDADASLIRQFLSLSENKVLNAEKNLEDKVNKRVMKVVKRAMSDKKFMHELLGKSTSDVKEIEKAVRNLPEQVIISKADYTGPLTKEEKEIKRFVESVMGIAKDE